MNRGDWPHSPENSASRHELKLGNRPHNLVVINNNVDELSKIFNSNWYGNHFLFNKSERLVYSSGNEVPYELGVKSYLVALVNKRSFSKSLFLSEGKNIKEEISFISPFIEKNKSDTNIIMFFSSFCNSCAPLPLINYLQRFHHEKGQAFSLYCILINDYSKMDAMNMGTQLKLSFPILVADNKLSKKWHDLIDSFDQKTLNNLAALLDKQGKILKILNLAENRDWKIFLRYLRRLQ